MVVRLAARLNVGRGQVQGAGALRRSGTGGGPPFFLLLLLFVLCWSVGCLLLLVGTCEECDLYGRDLFRVVVVVWLLACSFCCCLFRLFVLVEC